MEPKEVYIVPELGILNLSTRAALLVTSNTIDKWEDDGDSVYF